MQLRYQRSWRRAFEHYFVKSPLEVDLIPHAGFALGNVYTYGNVGATLRVGHDLKDDYGPPRVAPSVPGSSFFEPRTAFGWYLFASMEARAVGRNIFLDGNTFVDSRRVDKAPLVADLQVGLVLHWYLVRLSYTHVWRTKEFETESSGDGFGVATISVRW